MFTFVKKENSCTATLSLDIHAPKKIVWDMLTVNKELQKWFSELSIEELRVGGKILFDMQNGEYEIMEILSLEEQTSFSFTWDKDIVAFELEGDGNETTLTLIEQIKNVTDHTPRDLAGWHCCMDGIRELCEGVEYKQNWEILYNRYKKILSHT